MSASNDLAMVTTTFLQIALPLPNHSVFDYLPCDGLQPSQLQPGIRFLVSYGSRKLTGILLKTHSQSDCPKEKLKSVIQALDNEPVIDSTLLSLCQKTAIYYHRTIGETLTLSLPKQLRDGLPLPKQTMRIWKLSQPEALEKISISAHKQRQTLKLLEQSTEGIAHHTLKDAGISSAIINRLSREGLIKEVIKPVSTQPFYDNNTLLKTSSLTLNTEQKTAVDAISQHLNTFAPILLHGVTGSGKTEVYLQAIEKVLRNQQQALVLVPEIGLTPQTLKRFEQRFTVPVISLHSGLTDTERCKGWYKAHNLEAGIVISTRSGIFTPLPRLGLIVVDEEHDGSYKQQESIRYSARDLALLRGKQLNIPVILGSATPSLESLEKAWKNEYHYLSLTERAGNAKPPTFRLLDTRNTELHAGLSPTVTETIKHTLNLQQQVLVFINRRGFAPSLICAHCGDVTDCPHCDAHMTLHRSPPHLHCHHCDHQLAVPSSCTHCHSHELIATGAGTERTELALQKLFPDSNVLRIDRDSTRRKNSLSDMLAVINSNAPAILVGTQMLAKGHHFPGVTLVVIINADAGFFSTDFRGEEKTAQLLLQVAGRAGRGKTPGHVLIQTFNPDNPDLITLTQQGYTAFAKTQLIHRQQCQLPPFSYLALFTAESIDLLCLQEVLQQVAFWAKYYQQQMEGQTLLKMIGPMPAPMEKRQGRFRGQLLFQTKQRARLHHFLHWLQPQLKKLSRKKQLRWVLDIDPQETL